MGAPVQPKRMRLKRTGSDVRHILLLPAGLAGGLGREVLLPYRIYMRIRPKDLGPPLLRWGIGKLGGQPDDWLTMSNINLFFKDVNGN